MSRKILIVDDEKDFLDLLSDIIEVYDLEPIRCTSAEEALVQWVEHSGDIKIVLTDANMPGLNGSEFGSEIHASNPNITIVVISGMSEKEFKDQFKATFPYHFVPKPVDFNVLVEIIKASGASIAA